MKAEAREKLTTLNIHVERRKMKRLNLVIMITKIKVKSVNSDARKQ